MPCRSVLRTLKTTITAIKRYRTVIEFKGRLGTLETLGRWTLWDARGTLGGRRSKEQGRDGHGTKTLAPM